MRKNLLLTLWLLAPIVVFAGLTAWIFVSMSGPRAMDAAPVGPGAGDTGGANALGEWLAGRDPNLVERANIARREGRSVDPFWWPGGTEFFVPALDQSDGQGVGQGGGGEGGEGGGGVRSVTVGWTDPASGLLRTVALRQGEGGWAAVVRENRPAQGSPVFVSTGGMRQRLHAGQRRVTDDAGRTLAPLRIVPVSVGGTAPSDPIRVVLAMPG